MGTSSRAWLVLVALALASAGGVGAAPPVRPPRTSETLTAEVKALFEPAVAWRRIPWTSCPLEGLRRAREEKKPALLWVFIDRPADDARC